MHSSQEKQRLIVRIRRVRGQVEAVERAVAEGRDCADVLQMIAAARGAMNGLMAEFLEDHVRFHVLDPGRKHSAAQDTAADKLIEIVRSYLK